MKKIIFSIISCALLLSFSVSVFAGTQKVTSIPVTLTVVNAIKNIDVTVPASLPIGVYDGTVITATDAVIKNNSNAVKVKVSSVSVTDGEYTVSDYDNFERSSSKIAMKINGCPTKGSGALAINSDAFPEIRPNSVIPIDYQVKVSASNDVSSLNVANVILTVSAL